MCVAEDDYILEFGRTSSCFSVAKIGVVYGYSVSTVTTSHSRAHEDGQFVASGCHKLGGRKGDLTVRAPSAFSGSSETAAELRATCHRWTAVAPEPPAGPARSCLYHRERHHGTHPSPAGTPKNVGRVMCAKMRAKTFDGVENDE